MAKRKRGGYGARSRKRARYRTRRKFHRRSSRMVRQPRVIAESQIVKLRYVDFVTLDPAIGSPAFDTWSATSCYDPYVGVGGHQPLGFDQWMTFYNHYQVLGAKASCHARVYADAASDASWLIGQVSASTAAPGSNINQLIEQKRAKYSFLTSKNGSDNTGKVTVKYSPKRFFNLKNPRDEHDLRGDASSSPSENAYFQFLIGADNPSDNPAPINCRIVIDYVVLLTERKHLAQS